MKQLGVSLADEDVVRLEDLSRKTGHSLSALIRQAVLEMLLAEG